MFQSQGLFPPLILPTSIITETILQPIQVPRILMISNTNNKEGMKHIDNESNDVVLFTILDNDYLFSPDNYENKDSEHKNGNSLVKNLSLVYNHCLHFL